MSRLHATTALIGLTMLLTLPGCATTGRGAQLNSQELQGRVLHLEHVAEQRDQELAQLRDELDAERQARFSLERKLGGTPSAAATSARPGGSMTVREVQQALQRAGFDPGPLDGKMGRRTRTALRDFQQAHGLMVDGRIGPQTIAKLRGYMTPSTSGEK